MNPGLIALFMIIGAIAAAVIASNKNRNAAGILIVASLDTVRSEPHGGV